MKQHPAPSRDENIAQCEALLRHVGSLFDKHKLAGDSLNLTLDMEHMMHMLAGTVGYIAVELSSDSALILLDFIQSMLEAAEKRRAERERASAQ